MIGYKTLWYIYQPHLPCPTDSLDISLVVRSIQRKLGKPVKKANPTTKPIIVKLIDTLEGDQLLTSDFKKNIDIWQVVTKTVFKFYSFARFEEILILRKSDFLFFDNGDVEVTISKAKNNQFHEARTSYICKSDDKYCPVNLFKKYFLRIDSDLDHLFVPRISYDLVYLNELIMLIVYLNFVKLCLILEFKILWIMESIVIKVGVFHLLLMLVLILMLFKFMDV